jgi:hypothetical protein
VVATLSILAANMPARNAGFFFSLPSIEIDGNDN